MKRIPIKMLMRFVRLRKTVVAKSRTHGILGWNCRRRRSRRHEDNTDGRVLHEALATGDAPSDIEQCIVTHTAELDDYQQQVTATKVGNPTYLDEGNRVQV